MPVATAEMLDYVNDDPELTLIAYSPPMAGAYSGRNDKTIDPLYDHPGTPERLRVLQDVALEVGAMPGQVVLAWMMAGTPSVLPLFSASSVAQLEESLGAVEVHLDAAQLARLEPPDRVAAGPAPVVGTALLVSTSLTER